MADDWADGYDPTNPDGPEPKNMTGEDSIKDFLDKDAAPKPKYDPMLTNLGPVGFVKGAPQEDPLPMDVPPHLSQLARDLGGPQFGPNLDMRMNEGPFFTQSNRRGGQNEAHREIGDYLDKMFPKNLGGTGGPLKTVQIGDVYMERPTPSMRLVDDRMMDPVYKSLTPMGVALGGHDLDVYNSQFHMPNLQRDEKLGNDNQAFDDAITLRGMPDYMQKATAEQLAQDGMNSKMESETVWEGKDAPTQADIDKVRANPTDGMIQMFEDQFGAEATSKAFPDEEEKVPMPKPRPKGAPGKGNTETLPPITVDAPRKRK